VRITNQKTTALFFLLLGCTPLLLMLSFDIKQRMIRERMKEELETSSLQELTIPEKDVVWMDKHEIWVNDRMFDIHSRSLVDGVYHFTGLYDEDETRLVKELQKTTGKSNEDNRLLTQFFKCLPNIFIDNHWHLSYPEKELLTMQGYIAAFADEPFRIIITPPPQM
jgi:hypothetical protein